MNKNMVMACAVAGVAVVALGAFKWTHTPEAITGSFVTAPLNGTKATSTVAAPAVAPPLSGFAPAAETAQVPPDAPPTAAPAEKQAHRPAPVAAADAMANAGPDVMPQAVSEPLAREALNFVGADPVAEEFWIAAINDPSIDPHDRKNLIEDLNENGFADPNHPTADDLPLIESRIALIEDLGPVAADETNLAAFAEAYKDLINMRAQVVGK